MLGIFSGTVVPPPEELVAAGSRSPSPKTTASDLVARFQEIASPAMSVRIGDGDGGHLAYSHRGESAFNARSFAVKDEIYCLFEGALDNLGSLRQHYGLSKNASEVLLVIEAYKALRDRAPHPPSRMVGLLSGSFAFLVFDGSTSSLFAASDPEGKVPLYWGTTADGCVAFCDDVDLLKGSCGKSLALFPEVWRGICWSFAGCFYSTTNGRVEELREPQEQGDCRPSPEGEICGATFKVFLPPRPETSRPLLFSPLNPHPPPSDSQVEATALFAATL
ncbi:unnamed protein product [Spirodela intermedia]|uniref:DUF3700 domain-containing protein n=1 Tax=Spirodela intermedia TaxID=51605 RepID=A0A7I8JGZ2_SPIIN|nr:unnamed protein product [Spirodela intermedia]CAA6669025.1 unnamed protein product [Spirodela intermedia]